MIRHIVRAGLIGAAIAGFGLSPAQAFQFQDADGNTAAMPRNFYDLTAPTPAGPDHRGYFGDRKTTIDQGNFSLQYGARDNYQFFNQRYDFDSQFDRYDPFGTQNR